MTPTEARRLALSSPDADVRRKNAERVGAQIPAKERKPLRNGTGKQIAVSAGEPSGVQSITFEFPLPPTGCSPNNSGGSSHWRVKEGARAEYRAECLALLPRPVPVLFQRAVISVEFWLGPAVGRYHPRDSANGISAIKALCDAIVEAGYLIDDAAKYLTWGETKLIRSKARACVAVTLKREEAER